MLIEHFPAMEHSNIPTAKPDKVYIANFGRNNYLWPKCLEKSSIATLEDEDLRALWLAGDKDGYIKLCMNEKRSAAGIRPPASLASRWFNLAKIVSSTSGDMWIHRAKDTLWWTISGHGSISQELHPASLPTKPDTNVWEIHKPARAWMPEDMRGARLSWSALHPRAKEFLFTEGTMQRLSDDHAAYALALVSGKDLKEWHGRELWARKEVASKNPRGSILGARERSIAMMANTVEDTVRGSNGQTVERTVKNKESRFESKGALRKYLSDLLETQGGQ